MQIAEKAGKMTALPAMIWRKRSARGVVLYSRLMDVAIGESAVR
jgi:hypothetical protein